MSIQLSLQSISTEKFRDLKKSSLIVIKQPPSILSALRINEGALYYPFAKAKLKGCQPPFVTYYPRLQFPTFKGTLREQQIIALRETLNILHIYNSVIMSCYTGFGKTIVSVAAACDLKLKTLIIVTRVLLMNQWKDSILKVCPTATVGLITSASKNDFVVCDFGIINAQTICKMNEDFLKSFGTIIVDEVHLVMSLKTFKSLLMLTPRYLLALSATSYRNDELNALIPMFFGTKIVSRDLFREHNVFVVLTGFKPLVKTTAYGKVDWNAILESQASDVPRNNMIVDIVKKYPNRTFLILVKRLTQGMWLAKALEEANIGTVATLFGANQIFDLQCKVLIGTSSKIGTGFDFDKLDTLILGADVVDYYIQFIGRIMRKVDTIPWIFDLVDDNGIMKSHFAKRKQVYVKHGGSIVRYEL